MLQVERGISSSSAYIRPGVVHWKLIDDSGYGRNWEILCEIKFGSMHIRHVCSNYTYMKTTTLLPLVAAALLLAATASLRLEITEKDPAVSLVFETSGKHTFYAISSGKEKHDVNVIVDFRGQAVFNQTGTDL
jgi:hypothetical protein